MGFHVSLGTLGFADFSIKSLQRVGVPCRLLSPEKYFSDPGGQR